MRNICLLAIIAISLANYAKGDVTITATDAGGGKLQIGYQATGTLAPVAFALDIQLSNGATFDNIAPLTGDFPFYPSRFRDYIDPTNPNWEDPHYLPMTAWNSPDALGGLGTSGITIEMASMLASYPANGSAADFDADGIIDILDLEIFGEQWLCDWVDGGIPDADLYSDSLVNFRDYAVFLDGHFNPAPTMSGDLLLLQLNGNGAEITTANISLNFLRGGVVLEDATVGNAILPTQVTVIVPEPATILLFALSGLALRKRR
jgi:hypothetical protein